MHGENLFIKRIKNYTMGRPDKRGKERKGAEKRRALEKKLLEDLIRES
jgi:hypothetical protein